MSNISDNSFRIFADVMKTYFKIQYLRLNRGFRDFGVHPLVGYLALLIVFVGFSLLLFAKNEYANCLYLLLALFFIQKLSDSQRNDYALLEEEMEKVIIKDKIKLLELE